MTSMLNSALNQLRFLWNKIRLYDFQANRLKLIYSEICLLRLLIVSIDCFNILIFLRLYLLFINLSVLNNFSTLCIHIFCLQTHALCVTVRLTCYVSDTFLLLLLVQELCVFVSVCVLCLSGFSMFLFKERKRKRGSGSGGERERKWKSELEWEWEGQRQRR